MSLRGGGFRRCLVELELNKGTGRRIPAPGTGEWSSVARKENLGVIKRKRRVTGGEKITESCSAAASKGEKKKRFVTDREGGRYRDRAKRGVPRPLPVRPNQKRKEKFAITRKKNPKGGKKGVVPFYPPGKEEGQWSAR